MHSGRRRPRRSFFFLKALAHINTTVRSGADAAQLAETQALVETESRPVRHAHSQVRARRPASAKLVHDLFKHAAPVPLTLRAWQEVDVQV